MNWSSAATLPKFMTVSRNSAPAALIEAALIASNEFVSNMR